MTTKKKKARDAVAKGLAAQDALFARTRKRAKKGPRKTSLKMRTHLKGATSLLNQLSLAIFNATSEIDDYSDTAALVEAVKTLRTIANTPTGVRNADVLVGLAGAALERIGVPLKAK